MHLVIHVQNMIIIHSYLVYSVNEDLIDRVYEDGAVTLPSCVRDYEEKSYS